MPSKAIVLEYKQETEVDCDIIIHIIEATQPN